MLPTAKHKEVHNAIVKKYGVDKGKEVFSAYCIEHGIDINAKTLIDAQSTPLTFWTDNIATSVIETKSGKGYYVTGYISTSDLDVQNDIVTPECLRDMVEQITEKNIKLDVEHEAFLKDTATIPIGRIVEARLDKKGIWVKAELNPHHTRFEEVWNSLKNRFLDAFSITFKPLQFVEKNVEGLVDKVRMLYKVALLNVAITGNPAQDQAKIIDVFTKSVKMTELKQSESEMDKEKDKEKEEEEEKGCKKSSTTEVIPKVEVVEKDALKSLADSIAELKTELVSVKAAIDEVKKTAEVEKLETEVKSLTKEIVEVKAKLKQPVFKAVDTTSVSEQKALETAKITGRGVLGLI